MNRHSATREVGCVSSTGFVNHSASDDWRCGVEQRDGFVPPVHLVPMIKSGGEPEWDNVPPIPCLLDQDGFEITDDDTAIRLAWRCEKLLLEATCEAESLVARPDLEIDSPDFWRQDHIEFRTAPDMTRDLAQVQLIIASDGRWVVHAGGVPLTGAEISANGTAVRLDDGRWKWRGSAEIPFKMAGLDSCTGGKKSFRGLIARVRWAGDRYDAACTTACELGFGQSERFGVFRLSEETAAVCLTRVRSDRLTLLNMSSETLRGTLEIVRISEQSEDVCAGRPLEIASGQKQIEWDAPVGWPAFTCVAFVWKSGGSQTALGSCTLRGRPPRPAASGRLGGHPCLLFDEAGLSSIRAKLALPPFTLIAAEETEEESEELPDEQPGQGRSPLDITPRCMNWFRVARETMLRDGEGGRDPAAARLWEVQSEKAHEAWRAIVREVKPPAEAVLTLVEEMNRLLRMRSLYDSKAFGRLRLPAEGRSLLGRGIANLGEDELIRFNRILLQSAIECMPPFRMDLVTGVWRFYERWLATGDHRLIEGACNRVKMALETTIPGHETHLHEGMASSCLALAYDAFCPTLGDEEREIWIQLMMRFLALYLETAGRRSWTVTTIANANAVGNAGGGLLALALWQERPEQAAEALHYARTHIRKWLNWCNGPDGGNTEGAQYWCYGMENFLRFALALKRFTGHGDGLLEHPSVRNMMNMVRVGLCNDGALHGMNDTIPMPVGGHIGWFAAGNHGDAFGLWYGDHAWRWYTERRKSGLPTPYRSGLAEALLYRPAAPEMKSQPKLPVCFCLRSIEYSILRSDCRFDCDWAVGLKGSRPPYTHHNQADTGAFYLDLRGERLLLDPGYYKANASDHCLPLIGGQGPCVPKGWTGVIVEREERGQLRWVAVDCTGAYGPSVRRVIRRLVMIGGRVVVLVDDIDADANVISLLQCGGPVSMEKHDILAVHGRKALLGIACFGPEFSVRMLGERPLRDVHWGYSFADARWFPVEVAYRASSERPFVAVFYDRTHGESSRCFVEYGEGEIVARLEGRAELRLVMTASGWRIR